MGGESRKSREPDACNNSTLTYCVTLMNDRMMRSITSTLSGKRNLSLPSSKSCWTTVSSSLSAGSVKRSMK